MSQSNSSRALPAYVAAGTDVPAEWTRSDEAWDVLGAEELGYAWRRCEVPLADVEFAMPLRRTALVEEGLARRAEEARRFASMAAWARRRGGVAKALGERPLILVVDEEGVVALDGWHRAILALEANLETVPAMVGISTTPEAAVRRRNREITGENAECEAMPTPF